MSIDWISWDAGLTTPLNRLSGHRSVSSNVFNHAVDCLPDSFRGLSVTGGDQLADNELAYDSVVSMLCFLPVVSLGDFYVSSYTDLGDPLYGKYLHINLYKNDHRVEIAFKNHRVSVMLSKRASPVYYKRYASREFSLETRAEMFSMLEAILAKPANENNEVPE
jgi:hypothetical protein